MNILPHKSWHVRTKKNIARVRKDEAKAAEEEKELQRKISLAAQEARTEFLRQRASQRFDNSASEEVPQLPIEEISVVEKSGHVNFFQEIEDGVIQKCKVNQEYEQEKKTEQEDYEKKIGYLTYLGQNSVEQTKVRPWYEKIDRHTPSSTTSSKKEKPLTKEEEDLKKLKETKFKDFHDPLKDIRKYLQTPGVKSKIDNFTNSSSSVRKRTSSDVKDSSKDSKESSSSASKKAKKSKKVKKEKKHKKSKHKHNKKEKRKPPTSESESWTDETDSDDAEERQKQQKLAKLRAERLEREREEKRKVEKLMGKFRKEGEEEERDTGATTTSTSVNDNGPYRVKQKYNSQFNPHLARQNFDN